MHDDDPLLDRCPFRGGPCPDHAHTWQAGVCPDPPSGITATWPGAEPYDPPQGDRDE